MTNEKGVAVDAVIISHYIKEYVQETGPLLELVDRMLARFGMVVDDKSKIISEWGQHSLKPVFTEWVTDKLKNGYVRKVHACLPPDAVKKIHTHYGLPTQRSRDIEYIRCANVTTTRYILSEDIDFFDPKAKGGSATRKRKARDERCGALCNFLRKKLNITVGCPSHCRADLCL
jgi:hypothetical protein